MGENCIDVVCSEVNIGLQSGYIFMSLEIQPKIYTVFIRL